MRNEELRVESGESKSQKISKGAFTYQTDLDPEPSGLTETLRPIISHLLRTRILVGHE
jgi:hypothetical protein